MKQLQQVEIARMRQLADYLLKLPEQSFDLSCWVAQEARPAETKLFGWIEVKPACGFVGCAMGHAAYAELFPGLVLADSEIIYKEPCETSIGFDAAAKVMGVTNRVAEFLFGMKWYPSWQFDNPLSVAKRLNRFADRVERRIKRYNNKVVKALTVQEQVKKLLELEVA